jgi:cytochrome oxidase assembly protein ShyY1
LSPEKHHAYALQWFLIAVAAAFIALKVRKMEVQHEA